jgi:hypothetical protein
VVKFDGVPNSLATTIIENGWSALREAESSALRTASTELRKRTDELEMLIRLRTPLNECESEVNNARASLSSDLTQFFSNVELYREGVFSRSTKESIATLGIGAQLDALDLEFSESEKATFAAEVTRELFPRSTETFAKALTQLTELDNKLRLLIERTRSMQFSPPDQGLQKIEVSLNTERAGLQPS